MIAIGRTQGVFWNPLAPYEIGKLGWVAILLGLMHPLHGQIAFADLAAQAGVDEWGSNYGVSAIDYDGDGWEDVYIACRQHPNRLYRNLGNGQYENVAPQLGLDLDLDTRSAIWGDINNDGLPDLFVGTQQQGDHLFLQTPTHTFEDISAQAGMSERAGPTLGACLGDLDQDGWLDIYCARHLTENTFYRNRGDLTFEDVATQAGATDTGPAMGAILFDYDNDRDLDLYLVHDGRVPNILYQNDGTGQFQDVSQAAGADYAGFGMGVDVADVDHDGWLDIYITNLLENTLLINRGNGRFVNATQSTGVGDLGMGWGTVFFDADNDGWTDIYVCNSSVVNQAFANLPNVLYRNLGNYSFQRISDDGPLASLGDGYGVTTTDFNRDGLLDVFVANNLGPLGNELFENQTPSNHHWLKVKLLGRQSNRLAIGARVRVKVNGFWQTDEVIAGSSWASQQSLELHFGLGEAQRVDSLVVLWPSGQTDYWTGLSVDQSHQLEEKPISGAEGDWIIYPNPLDLHHLLTLTPTDADSKVQIFDVQGKQYLPQRVEFDSLLERTTLDLGNIPPGIYVLKLGERATKLILWE